MDNQIRKPYGTQYHIIAIIAAYNGAIKWDMKMQTPGVPLLALREAALEHVKRFAQYDANALWFHGFDASAFEVCARYGIAACVEFKTFRGDFSAHPS